MISFRRILSLTLCLLIFPIYRSVAQTPTYLFPQPPSHITTTQATLHGTIVPNDYSNAVWFEWSTNGSYSQITSPNSVTNGAGVVWLSATITNLTPYTAYQYRLVASNSAGVSYGLSHFFATGSKIAASDGSAHPSNLTNVAQLDGNYGYYLALTTEGTVSAWGQYGYAFTNVASQLTGVVSIAAGESHCLALKEDGTVVAWGDNTLGATNVPSDLTNVVAISAGWLFSTALKADGTLVTWGYRPVESGVLTNLVSAVAYSSFIMTLRADGTVGIYGINSWGGTSVPSGLYGVSAIAAAANEYLALKSDGTLTAWGYTGTTIPAGLNNVVGIAGGAGDTFFALQANGKPWQWGYYNFPPMPSYFSNVTAVAANSMVVGNIYPQAVGQKVSGPANSDLVITLGGSDANGDALTARIVSLPAVGSLYQYVNQARGTAITSTNTALIDPSHRVIYMPPFSATGKPISSFNFVLNDGDVDSAPATVMVNIEPTYAYTLPATQIADFQATLNGVILPNGSPTTAWFEWDKRGILDRKTAAQSVGNGGSLVRISAAITNLPGGACQFQLVASNAAVGLIRGPIQYFSPPGVITAWGRDTLGQIDVPPDLTNAVSVACGVNHSLALRSDSTVLAWGRTNAAVTNQPFGLTNVATVAAGASDSVVLKSDGTVIAWGQNTSGITNVPAGLSNVIALTCGYDSCAALKSDGTVIAWGYNGNGQLNVPLGLSNVVAIAAGEYASFALKIDGTVVAWGANAYGLTNAAPGLTNIIAISCGLYHTIALKSDGSVIAWGLNSNNQTNVPAGLTNVIAISTRDVHSIALTAAGMVVAWGSNQYGELNTPGDLCDVGHIGAGGYFNLAIGRLGNQPPEASPQTVSGVRNQDLVISLAGSDPDGDVLGFRIMSPPSFGTLYQYSAGKRGSGITDWNTLVADSKGRVIFSPEIDVTGKPYSQFDFVADDGVAQSAPQTTFINILRLPQTPTLMAWTPNSFPRLSMQGEAGTSYQLWVSTNLIHWEQLGNFQETSPGMFEFDDLSATNQAARFYRSAAE